MSQLVFTSPNTPSENKNLRKQVSERIRKRMQVLRKERGLTQQQVSDRAGLHLTYLGHLELGKYHPSAFVLWKIAQVFEISVDSFFQDQ